MSEEEDRLRELESQIAALQRENSALKHTRLSANATDAHDVVDDVDDVIEPVSYTHLTLPTIYSV